MRVTGWARSDSGQVRCMDVEHIMQIGRTTVVGRVRGAGDRPE